MDLTSDVKLIERQLSLDFVQIWGSPVSIIARYNKIKKRKQSGATAVEFAFVALPFFAMMFALFEIMMIFFVQTTLEAAVAEEARKIRTGQAQSTTAPISKAQFKAAVCDRMYGMGDCATRLFVMVESLSTAPTGPLTLPWDDGSLVPNSAADEPYDNSAPGQLVIVRAYYAWPLLTPGISAAFKNYSSGALGTNNRMLVATTAFRNEPYQ